MWKTSRDRAKAAIEGGADALSLVNTFTAMAIDIHKRRPRLANVTGGLSGPAIKPIALHLVSRVYRTVARIGGCADHRHGRCANLADAVEFILAGAVGGVAVGNGVVRRSGAPVRRRFGHRVHR
jgi:dihydroorotate dehydrogenase (NAD+) catalytic subunit